MKKFLITLFAISGIMTLNAQTTPEAVIGMLPDYSPTEQQIVSFLTSNDDSGRVRDYVDALSDAIKKVEEVSDKSLALAETNIDKGQEKAIINSQLKALGVSSVGQLKSMNKDELIHRAISASKSGKLNQTPKPSEASKEEYLKTIKKYDDKDRNAHHVIQERLGVALDSLSKVTSYYQRYWTEGGFAKRCSNPQTTSDQRDAIRKQYWTEVVRAYCPKVIRVMEIHKQLIPYDRLFDDYVRASAKMAGQEVSLGQTATSAYMRAASFLTYAKALVPNWDLYDE